MSKNEIAKRPSTSMKDKGQYAVALSLVGVMLYVAGFPVFFLLFVGVLTYFVWKIFSSDGRGDVRRIFEFYLSANEILRDDHRRWYGFEIQETIAHGEKIVRATATAPPLVHFSLGALYDRLGDHSSAVKHLSLLADETNSESGIVFPSNDLREYVRILRKIERSPGEAPQTSAAIRSLERLRKNKTSSLLEKNQAVQANMEIKALQEAAEAVTTNVEVPEVQQRPVSFTDSSDDAVPFVELELSNRSAIEKNGRHKIPRSESHERKTISEVLHDIYDENVQ